MPELICKILHISKTTYYSYLKKGYPIINFLNSFGKEGLEELLETGKIQKYENMSYIMDNYIQKNLEFYIYSFEQSQSLLHKASMHQEFKDFYFNFLTNFGKIDFPFNINVLGIQSLLTHYLYQYLIEKIKKNLNSDKINQILIEKNSEIDEAINSTNGKERKELEKFKNNLQQETLKEQILEDIFSNNDMNFEGIMLHFFTFNTWTNDMYYLLELVKKDEFEYFINSKNDELLYQAIGYFVYSYYQNFDTNNKLDLIYLIYHYFLANKDLISKDNIKKHIADRVNNPEFFEKIDEKLMNDYINNPFPKNFTSNLDDNLEEIETVTFEDLVNKRKNHN